jgi:hypothetical protein
MVWAVMLKDRVELQEALATEAGIRCPKAEQILMDLSGRSVTDLAGASGTVSTSRMPDFWWLCSGRLAAVRERSG